jgi:hypothetical protein
MSTEELEDDVIDVEEIPVEGETIKLDFDALSVEIERRKNRMRERGRTEESIARTPSSGIQSLLDANEDSMSDAIRMLSLAVMEDYEARGVSETHKRHTLVGKILKGDFDV